MILWAQVNFDERAHVRRLGLLTGINLEVTISGRKLKSPELSIITKGIPFFPEFPALKFPAIFWKFAGNLPIFCQNISNSRHFFRKWRY
jgi:hypothetical protein